MFILASSAVLRPTVLTFWSEVVCVEVEDSFEQSQLLQDDTEAVDVPLLGPTGGRTLLPQ